MESPLRGATLISLDRPNSRATPHLSVRFLSATEFVSQYADNLVRGGLFVRNAESLTPLEEVAVDLYLPGFKCFRLKARVTHVVDETKAEAYGSPVGAGLELSDPPASFTKALLVYLARLGDRGDQLVLVAGCDCMALLESAGYWSQPIDTTSILGTVAEQEGKIRALVIPAKLYSDYQDLLRATPLEHRIVIYNKSNANQLLVDLDAYLPA